MARGVVVICGRVLFGRQQGQKRRAYVESLCLKKRHEGDARQLLTITDKISCIMMVKITQQNTTRLFHYENEKSRENDLARGMIRCYVKQHCKFAYCGSCTIVPISSVKRCVWNISVDTIDFVTLCSDLNRTVHLVKSEIWS